LRFIGVLGVLLRGKKEGQISSLREEIRRLREEARFFVARALEVELLKAVGE
jgi:predicted nucleic acid-binding protein